MPWDKVNGNIVTTSFSAERNEKAYLKACDNVGNCSSEVSTLVKIDRTSPSAPTVTLVAVDWSERSNDTWYNHNIYVGGNVAGKNNWNDAKPSSSDNASGIAKYQISKDNSNWYDWKYSSTDNLYYISSEGTTYRYVRAIDNAGNISSVTKKTIKIDKTPPNVSCSWTAASSSQNQFDLKCTITDNYSTQFQFKYGYCYNSTASDASSKYYTCQYNSLENRYNSSGWKSFQPILGFQIKITTTIPSMVIKINFRDAVGNETGTYTWYKYQD